MSLYALNLFDLADNDDYLGTPSAPGRGAAPRRHGAALGKLDEDAPVPEGDTQPRQAMVLVEWPSREAFQAFLDDPTTRTCIRCARTARATTWWCVYEKLEDLRPLLKR